MAVETCAIPPFRILTKRVLLHSDNGVNGALYGWPVIRPELLATELSNNFEKVRCTSGATGAEAASKGGHLDWIAIAGATLPYGLI